MKKWQKITIFCDGSCYWKEKLGGIGIYMIWNDKEFFIQKGYQNTTISRCELRAFLTALEMLDKNLPILATIYSDSQYVVNGVLNNLWTWSHEKWRGCANEDLWKKILKQITDKKYLRIKLNWTRGHQKDISDPVVFGNAVADMLADYKQFKEYELDIRE